MTAHHRIFESAKKSWEQLAKEAEDFATSVGRERLINISVAAQGGSEFLGGRGVLIVWYWE